MTPERDFVEYLPPPVPAWHRRPTSPGWWILAYKRTRNLFQVSVEALPAWQESEASDECVYGPIPEPPEMPT